MWAALRLSTATNLQTLCDCFIDSLSFMTNIAIDST